MFPNSLNITQQIIDDLDLIYIWLILLMALFLLCLYFSFHALFFRSRLRSLRSALFRLLLLGLHHCLLLLRLLFYILFLFLPLHSLSLHFSDDQSLWVRVRFRARSVSFGSLSSSCAEQQRQALRFEASAALPRDSGGWSSCWSPGFELDCSLKFELSVWSELTCTARINMIKRIILMFYRKLYRFLNRNKRYKYLK